MKSGVEAVASILGIVLSFFTTRQGGQSLGKRRRPFALG